MNRHIWYNQTKQVQGEHMKLQYMVVTTTDFLKNVQKNLHHI